MPHCRYTLRHAFTGMGVLSLLVFAGCDGGTADAPDPAATAEQSAEVEAPPRAELDKTQLAAEAENRALVPSPAEMQKALAQAGITANLAEMVPERDLKMDVPNTDQVAVRTGVVIADLLLTVKDAKKPKMLTDLGKIKAGMTQLGAGKDIGVVIDDLKDRIQNDAVSRDDLVKELDELSGAVIPEIEYEAGDRAVPLIQAGSWLEGANLVARAIIESKKIEEGSGLLRQPAVVAYFQKYIATEGQDKAPSEVIEQLERTLETLQTIAQKPTLTEEDVKTVQETTTSVLDLL